MRATVSRNLLGGAIFPGIFLVLAGAGCKGGGGGGGGGPSPAAGGSPPVAVLSASTLSGAAPLDVGFDGSSSSDPEGAGITFVWDFGNGETSTGPIAAVTYSSPGAYTARLTVSDPTGLSDLAEVVVQVDGTIPEESFAHSVLHRTNLERRAQGLPPLKGEAALETAALGHAFDMAVEDFFAHDSLDGRTPWDRMEAAGYIFQSGAENIAAGQSTPAAVVAAWMGSAGHRANILNSGLRELGVGHFYQEDDDYPGPYGYRHYWVQDFGARDGVFPVVIDDEAYRTSDRTVELSIYGQGWAVQMKVSEDPSFSGAAWQPFAATLAWELSPSPGVKRVYVRLRGPASAERDARDEIILD